MRTRALVSGLALVAALTLFGCGDKPGAKGTSTNTQETGSSPLTAPVDYLGAVGKAQQTAIKRIDIASVTQAIQMFRVENDRFPKDLNELLLEKYLPRLPDLPTGFKYEYNPATGVVRVIKK